MLLRHKWLLQTKQSGRTHESKTEERRDGPQLQESAWTFGSQISCGSITTVTRSVATEESPTQVLHKCLESLQTDVETAIEEERKKDCQLQTDYIKRIHEEVRQQEPTG